MKELAEIFEGRFGEKPKFFAEAPGRLEILGNHTDYNEGIALSAAVSQRTKFAMSPAPGRRCRLVSSLDSVERSIDLDSVERVEEVGSWTAYIRGLICEIRKRGKDIGAFDAAISSDIPLSAGMSSSAALEVSALFAFDKAFGLGFTNTELAKIGQGAENNFVGVKSGLLDQFSSINGKESSLILCDFRVNEVLRTVKVPGNYVIVVINSMVKHTLVESDYNMRRESCSRALDAMRVRHPELKALRDVSPSNLDEWKSEMAFADYMRARHVVMENERVRLAIDALLSGRMDEFGRLLYESHDSSRLFFENSCPELDLLVELSKSVPGCIGARLSGGGFGGISIHFVEKEVAELYASRVAAAFKVATGIDTTPIFCELGSGARCVEA